MTSRPRDEHGDPIRAAEVAHEADLCDADRRTRGKVRVHRATSTAAHAQDWVYMLRRAREETT